MFNDDDNLPATREDTSPFSGIEFRQPEVPVEKLDQIMRAYHQFQPPKLITNAAERALVSQELVAATTQRRWAESALEELILPIRAVDKQVRSFFKTPLAVLENVEAQLKNRIRLFDNEERARLEAQQRREQEEARKLVEDANRRAREEAERKRKEEAARVEAERKAREQEAHEAELLGNPVQAKAIQMTAEAIVPTPVAEPVEISVPIVPIVEMKYRDGSSQRRVQRWRVVDRASIPAEFWLLDEKKIGAMCRSKLSAPPGIEFYEELDVTVRPGQL